MADAKALVAEAKELRAAGDAAGCLAVAQRALEQNAGSWPAVGCQCWALMELGRQREALEPLKLAVSAPKQPAKPVLADLRALLRSCRQTLEDLAFASAPRQPTIFTTEAAELQRLQRVPNKIRNICMLAHVDHGKTSLTDGLVASNR